MAEKVIIEFEPDFTKVISGIEALQAKGIISKEEAANLNKVSASLADVTAKTNAATEAATKNQHAGEQQTKTVGDLSKAMKELPLQIVTQATNQATEALVKHSVAITDNVVKSQSLKAQLRELKAELALMEEQGKENTAEFERMQIKAGKLSDQIGDTSMRIRVLADDSKYVKAVSQAITGLAAGFSILQGAEALFGKQNKEVEEALLKVNAAMAISNGLAQINEIIQKQSYVSILAKTGLQKLSVLTTRLDTAAQSENIIVSKAATAAQWLLNAAMEANPLLLLIGAITAAIVVFKAFGGTTKEVAKTQAELNNEQQNYVDLLTKEDEVLKSSSTNRIDHLEQQLNLAKAKGQTALADRLQIEVDKERIDLADKLLATHQEDVDLIGFKQVAYQNSVAELAKLETRFANETSATEREKLKQFIDDAKTRVTNTKAEYELISSYTRAKEDAENTLAVHTAEIAKRNADEAEKANKKRLDDAKKRADDEKKSIIEIFETDVALTNAQVLAAKKGSEQELALKIDLENAKAALARESVALADTSEELKAGKIKELKAGKIKEINNAEIAAITQLQNDFTQHQLDNLKRLEDERKKAAEEFNARSEEEYQQALLSSEEYYQQERKLLGDKFISGELSQKEYNAAIIKLEQEKYSKLKQLANDYAGTAKTAAADITKYDKQQTDAQVADAKAAIDKRKGQLKELKQASQAVASEIANDEFQIASDHRKNLLDGELDAINQRKERELLNKNLTESQKAAIERKYARQEAAAKLKDWEAEKEAKKEQAIINGALAVTNVLATATDPITAGIRIAAAALITAEQVRVIAKQEPPKFGKGKNENDLYEGTAIVGEAGRELRFDKNGKVTLYNQPTLTHLYKDSIIASNPLTEALLGGNTPMFNQAAMTATIMKYVSNTSSPAINNEKLADAIADKLKNQTKVAINIDEHGFEKRIIQGSNQRTVMNKRYTMNG